MQAARAAKPSERARSGAAAPVGFPASMAIALFDTDTPLQAIKPAILDKIAEVVARGTFILGPELHEFERELADYLGVRHVVGVANGTDAITIALRALGVAPGDDVVVRRSPSTQPPRRSSPRVPALFSAMSTRRPAI